MNAVRQLIAADNTLPELELGSCFRRGLLLWAFTLIYWLVPLTICSILGVGVLGLEYGSGSISVQDAQQWATTQMQKSALAVLIYVVWADISLPVYNAGLVRYASTGSWRSMLNIPANTALFLRHAPAFFMFYINWIVIVACIGTAAFVLGATFVGVPFIPFFVLTAYYVTTAHELGQLARKISKVDPSIDRHSTAKLTQN